MNVTFSKIKRGSHSRKSGKGSGLNVEGGGPMMEGMALSWWLVRTPSVPPSYGGPARDACQFCNKVPEM